jgi:hypothetical protein
VISRKLETPQRGRRQQMNVSEIPASDLQDEAGVASVNDQQPDAPSLAGARADCAEIISSFIDGLDQMGHLTGWGCLAHDPNQRVTVHVRSAEGQSASGIADLPRDDVRMAGYGDGRCGFSIPLPAGLLDGRRHTLTVTLQAPGARPLVTEIIVDMPSRIPAGTLPEMPPARLLSQPPPALLSASEANLAPLLYVPGHLVLCQAPSPLPAYHTSGWHEPEGEFAWIDGIEGIIEMFVRRPRTNYTLTLDVVPNQAGPQQQSLEVFFNYFRIGFFEVPEPTTLSLELPWELFLGRRSRLNLHCRNAVADALTDGQNRRRLGIAVRSWLIT